MSTHFSSVVVRAVGWTAAGRFIGQLVAWFVKVFVMRILSPTDYGLLAMATVIIGFLSLFAELGLGWAVVHAREVHHDTLRKVLGLVVLVHVGLFMLVFATAPLVG